MISKGNTKTSAEKKWHEQVSKFAIESSWLDRMFGSHCLHSSCFELDHIIGAQAKRKPFGKVGEWAVISLPYELHNIQAGGDLNRTLNPAAFRKEFGHEKELFKSMLKSMKSIGVEMPFSHEIANAIING